MPTIYVSRRGNSTNLRLRDSENHDPGDDNITTLVDPGNTITWEKDPRADSSSPEYQPSYSPILSIEKIEKSDRSLPQYSNDVDVLVTSPIYPVSGVVTGQVVSSSPGQGRGEHYQVFYYLPNDNTLHNDDPVMQMNS
jgi:hypothetical protein